MPDVHELRLELTALEDGQQHVAIYGTDDIGQWALLDDYTCTERDHFFTVSSEITTLVDAWLVFGGRKLPA